MLRKKNTPNGTMEALIDFACSSLQLDGFNSFSMGEVPFKLDCVDKQNIKSKIISNLGNNLNFVYNSDSLYNFKNKFNPEWQKIYLCGYPKISFLSILEMAWRCNYINLFVYQVKAKIKNYILLWNVRLLKLIKEVFTGSRIYKFKVGNFPN